MDAANVSQVVDATILSMWEKADTSIKNFFQHAAGQRKNWESYKYKLSEKSGQEVKNGFLNMSSKQQILCVCMMFQV